MALPPPSLALLCRGHRLAVSSATEAGLSIAAAAFAATPLPDLQRRGILTAVLEIREDGGEDRYDVNLRLVGAGQGTVELAFVDLAPELRRRLRVLAAQAEEAARTLPLAFARAAEAPASGGRRLVLPGSAAVWAVTSTRRDAFRQSGVPHPAPAPPAPAPRPQPVEEDDPNPRPGSPWMRGLAVALLVLAALVWAAVLVSAWG